MVKSQPIVKVRYGVNHFYLNTFPKSIEDLHSQFNCKMAHLRDQPENRKFKFRFQDPWNDMVELQNDDDLTAMARQTEGKQIILLEVARQEEERSERITFDLKGFVSYCQKLSPNQSKEFKFIMEEGDQVPCEDCAAKGVIKYAQGRQTCSNCSGSGARPLTPFWNNILEMIDYKLNQRFFDHLETYLAAWQSQPIIKVSQASGEAGGQLKLPSFKSAVSEYTKPLINVPPSRTKVADALPKHSAIENDIEAKNNDRLPSSVEVSDTESLVKQSPTPTRAQSFFVGTVAQENKSNLGPTTSMQSSNIWPAASSKIEIAQSPKPIYKRAVDKMSTSKKLMNFASSQFEKVAKSDRMSDEEQVTTKLIKFQWIGSPTVTVNREKPCLELKLKNTNIFPWGPWLSFILKSPKLKKAIQFDRTVPPGSSIHTTVNDLEGIEQGTLIIQVKGLDESSLTKFYSDKLELSVVMQ